MLNSTVQRMARDLKKASKENNARIWLRLSRLAQKPRAAQRVVNLNKISQHSKEGDVVVVPGKVLATGSMRHKITLCSFSISSAAIDKVTESGGRVRSLNSVMRDNPTGKGVLLLG